MPKGWYSAPAKHVVSLNPEVLPENTPEETELSYVDIAALEGGDASANLSPKELTFGTAPSRARRVLRQGDTVLSTVRTYLKAVANFPDVSEGLVASTGFAVLRPNGRLHPRFAYWGALSEPFIDNVVAHSEGVSYPAINPSVLASLHLPVPPMPEQERIANFLDEQTARIDALIAEKERLRAAIEESWTARLCHSLQAAAGMGEADVTPGWCVIQLKRLCSSIQTGRTPSGTRDDCFSEDGTIWATPGDLHGLFLQNSARKVSDSALSDDEVRLYPKGSTLLVGIGATVGTVAHANVPTSANQQLNILVPRLELVDPLFLTLAVAANREQVRLAASAATLPIINQEKTGRVRVAVPCLEEQIRLRSELLALRDRLTSLGEHAREHIARLREYRSSLISMAVTGQLDLSTFKVAA